MYINIIICSTQRACALRRTRQLSCNNNNYAVRPSSRQTSAVHELFDQVGDHRAAQDARGRGRVGFLAGPVVVVVVVVRRVDRVLVGRGVHVRSLFGFARDDRYHVQRYAQSEHAVLAHLAVQPETCV